ncbi:hypothetical protein [Paracoccus salsus]|uniref:hypothetical protein n=1 Tax=Paracoccus salsus TaxID=2911061 RepID=UPI001F16C765|nr:hypothetical protein [Paracoccus salsus]MCF3974239.1 hypothetical protein [Paracoccus salsus]
MQIHQVSLSSTPVAAPQSPADRLEQAFLEEMLKYCGPRAAEGGFSGGIGEDQFASFLNQQHAAILSRKLDLGFDSLLPGAAG